MGPPGVSCRPLGCFKLQLLFFTLQFLPDQRSLRCGNLRQHSENTMGNTPRPVPSQPASPCSTVAVAPAPAALQGSGGRLSAGSCQAGSSWGCGQGSGQLDPDAVALVGRGGEHAGSSQSQLSFCDPNRIFQTAANPGAAGAGGVVTTQPVTGLLQWVGMLQQPIVAQLPGELCAGSQSQPGPLLCRDHTEQPISTQLSGGHPVPEGG